MHPGRAGAWLNSGGSDTGGGERVQHERMSRARDLRLKETIEEIIDRTGMKSAALAVHDYETGRLFTHDANVWFHAASTIKIPVLIGVFAAIESGALHTDSRVHVRNRFFSAADGTAFRVEAARDAGAAVHQQIGKTMRVDDLARQMIVTSSNLATNILIDLIGLESLHSTLERLGSEGIDLRRGVEDEAAFEAGLNNRVTAAGLVQALGFIEEEVLSPEASRAMLGILCEQEFRSGIPAGVPDTARVANKTGEISTVAHDTGLVYLRGREPYALAILTEWDADLSTGRREALAELSRAVYQQLVRPADA